MGRLKDVPLEDPQLTFYVVRSREYIDGAPRTGWAVVNEHLDVERSGRIDGSLSAQVAELVALTEALKLAEGKTVNIYTNSRYAFGVVHDYMTAWGRRDFITTGGEPVKNQVRIRNLLEASSKPTQAAVIKIKAHQKVKTKEQEGNQAADKVRNGWNKWRPQE
uniref:ribonuclease H-like n=1 Tax=Pristiophorus japonicus TaxID=55135 RepID=UPI00398EE68E